VPGLVDMKLKMQKLILFSEIEAPTPLNINITVLCNVTPHRLLDLMYTTVSEEAASCIFRSKEVNQLRKIVHGRKSKSIGENHVLYIEGSIGMGTCAVNWEHVA
jgi:hypothetical protein